MRPALVLLVLCLLPGTAAAQLQATQWSETSTASANSVQDTDIGQDISMPETVSAQAIDGVAGATSAVNWGPPGPPQGTAVVSAFIETGTGDVTAIAVLNVNFFARVMQTSTPPVSVTSVPVSLTASGTVGASGTTDFPAQCLSDVTILLGGNAVLEEHIEADNDTGSGQPASDSFDVSTTVNAAIGEVFGGSLVAQASITALSATSGGSGATAFVDPVVEVADEIIPGTAFSYQDFYDVEFGSGYDALGNTPVESVSWGKVKWLFLR